MKAVTRGLGERIMYRGHRETIMTSVIHASLGHSLRRNIRIDYDPGDPSSFILALCPGPVISTNMGQRKF